MSLIDIILLAVALAMDCFTVSIVSGLMNQNHSHEPWIYRMALLFGLFQALMPLLQDLLLTARAESLTAPEPS